MPQDGRQLGASAPVSELWPRRLLRLFEKQTRHGTFSRHEASRHSFARARRKLDVVLHRRSHVRRGLSSNVPNNSRATFANFFVVSQHPVPIFLGAPTRSS